MPLPRCPRCGASMRLGTLEDEGEVSPWQLAIWLYCTNYQECVATRRLEIEDVCASL